MVKPITIEIQRFEDFRGWLSVPVDKSIDFRVVQINLEDDTLMQWCVDNDFCGEPAQLFLFHLNGRSQDSANIGLLIHF